MPNPVLNKRDFVRRYQANEFGNRSPTWEVEDWYNWEHQPGLFHLRSRIAGGPTFYNLSNLECVGHIQHIDNFDDWYISEMAPTERTLIQGEVQRTAWGIYLRYTRVPLPMREALAKQQDHVWGLAAKLLLQKYLCVRSYEWLEYLLDTYPCHVVEFSTYSICWGTVPGMNTVFWETRLY